MPVVPTSQVSVIPTAPRVDIQSFVPKLDPTAGLGTFMAAAQLPLAMEQIDLQREKNKAERSQLDFLKKQTEYNIRNYDAIQAAARAQAQLEADIKREALRKAALDTETARLDLQSRQPVSPERLSPFFRGTDVPAGNVGAGAETETGAEAGGTTTLPLTDVTTVTTVERPPATLADVTTVAEEQTAEEIEARRTTERENRRRYTPDVSNVSQFVRSADSEQAAFDEEYNRRVAEEFGPSEFITNRRLSEVAARLPAISKELKPKDSEYRFVDGRGVPMTVGTRVVGDRVIGVRGDAKIDVETLHKTNTAVKRFDEAFADEIGKMSPSQMANAQQNINRLMDAVELHAESEKTGGPIERSRLIPFLPDSVQALVATDKFFAREQVRTAIQQSLREVLGAAFTRAEGESMMNRSFNLFLSPGANVEMVRKAVQVAETAVRDREDQIAYFQNNGTLFQFKPVGELVNPDGSPNLARLDVITKQLVPAGMTTDQGTPAPIRTGPTEEQVKTGAEILKRSRAKYNASPGSIGQAAARKP